MSDLRLTNSEMKTYKRCRRQWYLGYYRGLQPKGLNFNHPLSIGQRTHDVLSFYYVPGLDRDRAATMAHFKERVEADVAEHPHREEDIRKEADLCDAMLEGYFDWLEEEGHDSDLEVIEPESEMEVRLVDGATILSKIDARVKRVSDGKVGALEHKTAASLTDPVRKLQVDQQLLTEHLVEYMIQRQGESGEAVEGDNPADFVLYNMLKKVKRTGRAKPPFFDRHEVRHNLPELRNHWRHVQQQALEIMRLHELLDAGADHHDVCYPNPTNECTWDCDFRDVCLPGLMDDGSDWEAFCEDAYESGDPLERYRYLNGLPSGADAANASEHGDNITS